MEFRIADTFTESLAKLTGDEQKAVKTTAFDLQLNPASPGMQFHKLDRVKDKRFWSVRVNNDIRLIVHRSDSSLLLCYVGRHDNAYSWAERRKLETHPKTGAAQLVEVKESVKKITIPIYVHDVETVIQKTKLFEDVTNEELLYYGVPEEWIEEVREADEDTILELAEHLPSEAAEALLSLATGVEPALIRTAEVDEDPFEHPDAQRRFRVMNNVEELERALEYPWDKWTIFLHPSQKSLVESSFNGPARISGTAGTGKTIVALHRAVYLARINPDARVLLATFSEILANMLRSKLKRLIYNEPRVMERIEVYSLDDVGLRLYELNYGKPKIATNEEVNATLADVVDEAEDKRFSIQFVRSEWQEVVDAWQLSTWDEYRDVKRLGRKTRLPEKQRAYLWSIFEKVRDKLAEKELLTYPEMFGQLKGLYDGKNSFPYDSVVIDEAQDISVAQLRFLSAIRTEKQNGLFFTGDLGQRIFQQPFSWKALGVDIRGRAKNLKINYRTSHQIRMQADRLLGPEITDLDGNIEQRGGTISVFNGPKPQIRTTENVDEEKEVVSNWLLELATGSYELHEIGVFVRSDNELQRAFNALNQADLQHKLLDEKAETVPDVVAVSTMHMAKGLEFRAVVVMACDDEVIPLQERIETAADVPDLEDVYNTERHLLYVACTRARDNLLITGVEPASEFLDDLF